jgi:3-oxoacyl-[acyl-carrier protein] reductase
MDLKLKGKKAIVTGGTKGIGLRIARQLAEEGVDVAICARTAADVDATVAELKDYGVNAAGGSVDIFNDAEGYKQWVDSAARELGGLDIFVSNVSGTPTIAGEEGWRRGFEGDIMGAVRGCETAMPYLKESGEAAIILIASVYAVMTKVLPAPGLYAYSASKAALIAYGTQLSKEVGQYGIRVNSVSPGAIYFEGGAWDHIQQNMPEAYAEALKEAVVGRLGKPEEIAAAVAFLASPISGFTTGENLHIDGGYMHHIPF